MHEEPPSVVKRREYGRFQYSKRCFVALCGWKLTRVARCDMQVVPVRKVGSHLLVRSIVCLFVFFMSPRYDCVTWVLYRAA